MPLNPTAQITAKQRDFEAVQTDEFHALRIQTVMDGPMCTVVETQDQTVESMGAARAHERQTDILDSFSRIRAGSARRRR